MSYKSDLIYKIPISRIKGVGDITVKKLISQCRRTKEKIKLG